MKKTIFAVLGLTLFLGQTVGVGAQSAVSIKIQPALIEERIEPGARLEKTIKVTNIDQSRKTLYLVVRDIEDLSPSGNPVFSASPRDVYGVANWVSFPRKSVTLGAGEASEVPVVFTVPKDAAPGGHFGAIFFSSEPVRPGETGAGVGFEVGTIVNLRIAGETSEEARIREFRTGKSIYDRADVDFSVRVENLGNVLVRPRGPLEITNMFGKSVATLRMNDEAAAVFPKGEREFGANWKSSGLAFGRYEATLGLVYGEDVRKTTSATASFWVLPMKLIAEVLIALVVLIGGSWFALRAYVARKVREAGGGAALPASTANLPPSPLIFAVIAVIVFALFLLALLFFIFG